MTKELHPYTVFPLGPTGDFAAVADPLNATESTIKQRLQESYEIPPGVDVAQLNWFPCRAFDERHAIQLARQGGLKFRAPSTP